MFNYPLIQLFMIQIFINKISKTHLLNMTHLYTVYIYYTNIVAEKEVVLITNLNESLEWLFVQPQGFDLRYCWLFWMVTIGEIWPLLQLFCLCLPNTCGICFDLFKFSFLDGQSSSDTVLSTATSMNCTFFSSTSTTIGPSECFNSDQFSRCVDT